MIDHLANLASGLVAGQRAPRPRVCRVTRANPSPTINWPPSSTWPARGWGGPLHRARLAGPGGRSAHLCCATSHQAERNDLTPEVLENLAWLGVDYLIPIGGDDTLSYAVRLFQEGVKVVGHSEDHVEPCSGYRLLHWLQHLRDPHHRDGQPAAHLCLPARTPSGAGGLWPLRRIHRHAANHLGGRCQSLRDS